MKKAKFMSPAQRKELRQWAKATLKNISSADDRARAIAFAPSLAEITVADVEQTYELAGKEF